jgi:peptidoglycan/LPS O-acetylase OafA/YrhL
VSTLDDTTEPSTVGGRSPAESQQREVSGGAHFASLDGYRAVAAVMVLLTHVAFATGVVVLSGWGHLLARFDIGVALFFLLSGFLLYRPWARAALAGAPRPSLRRYAVRRSARVIPLYLVVVVVTLSLLPELRPVSLGTWLSHLFAVQIYQPRGAVEGLTQTWSLCTEISFYVLLPLLGSWVLRRGRGEPRDPMRRQVALLLALVLVAVVFNLIRVSTSLLPLMSAYWLPGYLDWFAIGMGLAVVQVRSQQADPPAPVTFLVAMARDQWTCLAMAAALLVVAVTPLAGAYDFNATGAWESMLKHTLYVLSAALFLLPGVLGGDGPVVRGLSRRPAVLIGLVSYGVFLWHLVLLRAVMLVLGIPVFTGGFWLVAGTLLVVTLLVATVTYRLVERPAQRWAHRL